MDAYRAAVASLSVEDLTEHYTRGLAWFERELAPCVRRRLEALSGGAWALDDFVAYAAGSDVDLMAHVVEAAAAREGVTVYPGDWYGFLAGTTQTAGVRFAEDPAGTLAACCVPSVRNGHTTEEMVAFLARAPACLLNVNLFPTLAAEERRSVALALQPILRQSMLSVSFSRGFGLTASQLGVLLVPRDHPFRARFEGQWRWLTYFHNAIAGRAFMAMDLDRLAAVDQARRAWSAQWLRERGLPCVETGSYYVKSFRVEGALPDRLRPLCRDGLVRLCLKPPIS